MKIQYYFCRKWIIPFALPMLLTLAVSCSMNTKQPPGVSDAEKKFYGGKGVGPVKAVAIGALDTTRASAGKSLFQSKCISCHYDSDQKLIGPGLAGVTLRRTPEWILNQILNPIGMTQSDSLAKELLTIYFSQMTPMGLSESEARDILEYFRLNDGSRSGD